MLKQLFLQKTRKQLIISCQAPDSCDPFYKTSALCEMAKAVLFGGATALRLSQAQHIQAIRALTSVPIIGLIKQSYPNSDVYITPTLKEIKTLLQLQIECIALDATDRTHPQENLFDLINYVKNNAPHISLLADCATLADVQNAHKLGFDLIATTLRGYTATTQNLPNRANAFAFVYEAAKISQLPVIAEGGINTPQEVATLLQIPKVHAVVVGSAITRPQNITRAFYDYLKQ